MRATTKAAVASPSVALDVDEGLVAAVGASIHAEHDAGRLDDRIGLAADRQLQALH